MSEQNIISKYVPNFITLLSLSSGFSSISFSLKGEWEIAIYLILLATIFDFFDGWFARKLKSGSNFGAELDSLSDFVSFGVAPSFLVYLWSTNSLGSLGWGATLFFVICSSLRLARFTADIYITNKPIDNNEKIKYLPKKKEIGSYDKHVLEDNENFIVINKPTGLPVQSGTKSRKNIIDMLRKTKEFYGNSPYTVHRIDKETTGILLVAKNRKYAQKQIVVNIFRICFEFLVCKFCLSCGLILKILV